MAMAGWFLLANTDAPALSDHPYQFARASTFADSMNSGRDPLGWSQEFSGGYPELQFYPPGHASVTWLLSLPFGDLPFGYWLLVVTAWFAPAWAGAASLLLAGAKPASAALGGFLVGYLSFGHAGTVSGVALGVLGTRLSLACALLTLGLVVWIVPRGAHRHSTGATVALGLAAFGTAWFHVYHVPTLVLAVAIVGWRLRRHGNGDPLPALVAVAGGLVIAGFWWLPLAVIRGSTVPFVTVPEKIQHLGNPDYGARGGLDWLLLASIWLIAAWKLRGRADERPFVLGWVVPAAATATALSWIANAWFGLHFFNAIRVYDGVLFGVAATVSLALEPLSVRGPNRWRAASVVVASFVIGLVWFGLGRAALPPSAFGLRQPELDAGAPGTLWRDLSGGSGRVVFTSATFQGITHVMGQTTRRSGVEAINGGSANASPMQAILVGGPGADVVREADVLGSDNRRLLGLDWTDVQTSRGRAETLAARLRQLGVTRIVVSSGDALDDAIPLQALSQYPNLFVNPTKSGGVFTIFTVAGSRSERVDTSSPGARVNWTRDDLAKGGRLDAEVSSTGGATVTVHLLPSPYSTVSIDDRTVDSRVDDLRQIVVDMPPGTHLLTVTQNTPDQVLRLRVLALTLGGSLVLGSIYWGRRSAPRRS